MRVDTTFDRTAEVLAKPWNARILGSARLMGDLWDEMDGPAERVELQPHGIGRIYFVQGEHGGPVKIGRAQGINGVVKRIRELQTANPEALVLRSTMFGGGSREAFLHTLFAPWRLEGEWFTASAPVAAYSGAIPDPDQDGVSPALPYSLIGLFDAWLPKRLSEGTPPPRICDERLCSCGTPGPACSAIARPATVASAILKTANCGAPCASSSTLPMDSKGRSAP